MERHTLMEAEPLRPEGFYRIRLEGQPGVAYCKHSHHTGMEPYETWTTLHLFTRFSEEPHPASASITRRSYDRASRILEVLSRIRM